MKYKKIIYLIVVILSLIATVYEFIVSLNESTAVPIQLFEFINMTGVGVIVLALIILKIAFDISFIFEMVLLVISIVGILTLKFGGSQFGESINGFMIQTVFPILSTLFIIEYVKDLLLSDKVFTSSGIIIKGLLNAAIVIVIVQIGSIYSAVSGVVLESVFEYASSVVVLYFMAMIYLVKMGYKREIRELVEHSYFSEDLRRLSKDTLKVYELILVVNYIGVIFLYFKNLLPFQIAFAFMVGGVFFAARGYRQWMFPFVLMGTLSSMTYLKLFASQNIISTNWLRILSLEYAKGTVYGIILVLIFVWVTRIVIATSNRNIET